MRVIGWDIGIKNLSYCIFNTLEEEDSTDGKEYFEFNNNKYELIDWQVLNIIPNIERAENELLLKNRYVADNCCSTTTIKKTGEEKPCKTKPKFVDCSSPNEVKFYCLKHKNEKTGEDYEVLKDINMKKTGSCCVENCYTAAVFVSRLNNFYGYCKKHFNAGIKSGSLNEEDVYKLIKEKKADKNGLTLLAEALYKELDNYPQILDAECVLFENQPVLKNPTMKSMQIFLYGYYMMNGYMKDDKAVNEIHCYSANKKIEMQFFVKPEDLEQINKEIGKVKSKYTQTKKKGIALVEYFFENNYVDERDLKHIRENQRINPDENIGSKIKVFEDKKKRDDLADSLLMTLHFLEKKEITRLKKHAL